MKSYSYFLGQVAEDSGYASWKEYLIVQQDTLTGLELLHTIGRMHEEAAGRFAFQYNASRSDGRYKAKSIFETDAFGRKVKLKNGSV